MKGKLFVCNIRLKIYFNLRNFLILFFLKTWQITILCTEQDSLKGMIQSHLIEIGIYFFRRFLTHFQIDFRRMENVSELESDFVEFGITKKEQGRNRFRGRKGIATKSTIKFNSYDKKFTGEGMLMFGNSTDPNNQQLQYSIGKNKLWEQVETQKQLISDLNLKKDENEEAVREDDVGLEILEAKQHKSIHEFSYKIEGTFLSRYILFKRKEHSSHTFRWNPKIGFQWWHFWH